MKSTKFKRLTALFLAIVLATFGLSFANVSAESYNGFTYSIKTNYEDDSQYIVITGYEGTSSTLDIPSEIDGLTVTKIEYGAFTGNETITTVNVPDSVKSIEGSAFRNCKNLSTINLPDTLEEIGYEIFYGTAYESNNMVNRLLYIDNYLVGCDRFNLDYSNIIVKEGTVLIADYMFNSEEITTVSLPQSLKYIGSDVFGNCDNLTTVTLPSNLLTIGNYAFSGCDNLKSINIPGSVQFLGSHIFDDCVSLTSLDVPASITKLPTAMIKGCKNITSFEIKDTVTELGINVFSESGIKSIHIPASVAYLDSSCFTKCSELTEITVDSANENYYAVDNILYKKSFYSENSDTLVRYPINGATSFSVPAYVASIDGYAFSGNTDLKEITLNSQMGSFNLYECYSVENIYVDSANESLTSQDGILYSNNGTALEIYPPAKNYSSFQVPASVLEVDMFAFYYNPYIISLTIPATVTKVDSAAVFSCENLEEINMQPITGISNTSIDYCYNLHTINFAGTIADWEAINMYFSLTECDGLYIYCSDGTIEAVPPKITEPVTTEPVTTEPVTTEPITTEPVTTAPTVTDPIEDSQPVPSSGFKYQTLDSGNLMITGIENVPANLVIPAEIDGIPVEKIGLHAFSYKNNLESVVISDGVKTIGEYAFAECPNLKSVQIPDSVTTIEDDAFWYCTGIDEVYIVGVETIGMNAFGYCKSIEKVYISNNLKEVDFGAFFGCDAFTEVYFAGENSDLANIIIGESNDPLLNAYLYYFEIETSAPTVTDPDEKPTTAPDAPITKPTTLPQPEYELGDVNTDGKINIKDATTIQKYCAKLSDFTETQMILADYNLDSKINVKDATQIQKKLANLI